MADTNVYSEMFGASEDESPELDHSEDSENGSDPSRTICAVNHQS
jgi:hypothetical protein